jgi:hypothetical protein
MRSCSGAIEWSDAVAESHWVRALENNSQQHHTLRELNYEQAN